MTTPFNGQEFLFLWFGFLLLMSTGVAVFFIWGIRSRQFTRQDRARYLPLMARIPRPEELEKAAEDGRGQK